MAKGHSLDDVLVSYGCRDKLPPTRWLKTTEIYWLPIQEV